jgi:basic membrane protein A
LTSGPSGVGPLKDTDGTERVAAGTAINDAGLWKMDWFLPGVITGK